MQLQKAGLGLLNSELLSKRKTDEMGRPLQGLANADEVDSLSVQNLLLSKDIEILYLRNKIKHSSDNRNEIETGVVAL